MNTRANPHDDDMPAKIDFSKGTRGKFHQPGMQLSLPVYLDDQVQATLVEVVVDLDAIAHDALLEPTTCRHATWF